MCQFVCSNSVGKVRAVDVTHAEALPRSHLFENTLSDQARMMYHCNILLMCFPYVSS